MNEHMDNLVAFHAAADTSWNALWHEAAVKKATPNLNIAQHVTRHTIYQSLILREYTKTLTKKNQIQTKH